MKLPHLKLRIYVRLLMFQYNTFYVQVDISLLIPYVEYSLHNAWPQDLHNIQYLETAMQYTLQGASFKPWYVTISKYILDFPRGISTQKEMPNTKIINMHDSSDISVIWQVESQIKVYTLKSFNNSRRIRQWLNNLFVFDNILHPQSKSFP